MPQQSEQDGKQKMELKEQLSSEQLKGTLSRWLDAIENSRDFEIEVKGETCRVPQDALSSGRIVAEFETKGDEYEFELKLKWQRH